VFEGLLPEPHNQDILSLLFTLAEWHALAKLRLHTDSTLDLLDKATSDLGRQLRRFQSYTCTFFKTKELPKEEAARGRRRKNKAAADAAHPPSAAASVKPPPKTKLFNLFTYKLHALGDYARTIRWFGTSDSYSTQPVQGLVAK
jgi:hypothetical protein